MAPDPRAEGGSRQKQNRRTVCDFSPREDEGAWERVRPRRPEPRWARRPRPQGTLEAGAGLGGSGFGRKAQGSGVHTGAPERLPSPPHLSQRPWERDAVVRPAAGDGSGADISLSAYCVQVPGTPGDTTERVHDLLARGGGGQEPGTCPVLALLPPTPHAEAGSPVPSAAPGRTDTCQAPATCQREAKTPPG